MRAAIGWLLCLGVGVTGCGFQAAPTAKTVNLVGNNVGLDAGQAIQERVVANVGMGPGDGSMGPGGGSSRTGRRPPFIGPRRPPYHPPRIPGRGDWPGYLPGGSTIYMPPVSTYQPEVPVMRAVPPPAMSASPYGSSEETRQAAWRNWWQNTDEGRKDYWERVLGSNPYGGSSSMEDPEAAGINWSTAPTGKTVTPPTTGWPPLPK